MTTSFITDQADQELQLSNLQNMNGGVTGLELALAVAVGASAYAAVDSWTYALTGKGITEHVMDTAVDAIKSASGSSDQNDGCNVAPTGDGKGCTDRGLPF